MNGKSQYASLVEGPALPANGRLPARTTLWPVLWKATDYEPDPVIASTYGGGALQSFGGYLYWGTMHVPLIGTVAALNQYGPAAISSASAVTATQRASAIFRGSNLTSANRDIQLLYGDLFLTRYNASSQTWVRTINNMSALPAYGSSGMGNEFNNYIWSMAVWQNKLWVGTMNWAYVYKEVAPMIEGVMNLPPGTLTPPSLGLGTTIPYGANLAYFSNTYNGAYFDDNEGMGNYLNYGVRNLLPIGNTMYLGTANPMNLKTDPTTDKLGGWELLKLKLKSGQ